MTGKILTLNSLFTPFSYGSLTLRNRFVMAPMSRYMSFNNLLPMDDGPYYARRAAGGCGLIVTEAAAIPHPVAHSDSTIPNFYGTSLERWEAVGRDVHDAGGVIFAQLWHTGTARNRAASLNPGDESVAPSAVGRNPARPMTDADIADVTEAYAQAAADAQKIGFDGIEIHGAHGYLPDQFFWPRTNRRKDRYGGSLGNRVRFACEAVSAIRRRVGPSFPIMFRFSQWKGVDYDARIAETPAELEEWLCPLAEAGVDIFDASTRRFWLPEFDGSDLNLAGWAKKITGKASMTVGSVGLESPLSVGQLSDKNPSRVSTENLAWLVTMFERGDFDLVGIGRIVLSNPQWPQLVRDEQYDRIRPFDPTRFEGRLDPSED